MKFSFVSIPIALGLGYLGSRLSYYLADVAQNKMLGQDSTNNEGSVQDSAFILAAFGLTASCVHGFVYCYTKILQYFTARFKKSHPQSADKINPNIALINEQLKLATIAFAKQQPVVTAKKEAWSLSQKMKDFGFNLIFFALKHFYAILLSLAVSSTFLLRRAFYFLRNSPQETTAESLMSSVVANTSFEVMAHVSRQVLVAYSETQDYLSLKEAPPKEEAAEVPQNERFNRKKESRL